MRTSFESRAWVAWAAGVGVLTLAIDNPASTLVVLFVIGAVNAAFARPGPEGRSFGFMLKLGCAFMAIRVALFGLTGHTGETTLLRLPEWSLPGWLGRLRVGGRITAEVLSQSFAEGLRVAAFIACAGVLLGIVDTARVLRLVPRSLHQAGLIVSIALAFVPTLLRSAADIRDAQRLRGHRFRGLRSLRPLVLPILASALERSMTLAASMECRAYGRARAAERTRYAPEAIDRWDAALIVSSLVTILAAFTTRNAGGSAWYPYPAFMWPRLELLTLAVALTPLAPLVISNLRDRRLRAASEEEPVRADLAEARR